MKDSTLYFLIGGAVLTIFLMNKASSPTGLSGRSRPVFRRYTPRLGALVHHEGSLPQPRLAAPVQGDGFGMDHRSRYGYAE